ncbi:MAG: HAD-IIIC family phosphatase [Desulfovibrionaceae bacterium]
MQISLNTLVSHLSEKLKDRPEQLHAALDAALLGLDPQGQIPTGFAAAFKGHCGEAARLLAKGNVTWTKELVLKAHLLLINKEATADVLRNLALDPGVEAFPARILISGAEAAHKAGDDVTAHRLLRLAGAKIDSVSLQRRALKLYANLNETLGPQGKKTRVAVLGNGTFGHLVDAVSLSLLGEGLVPEVMEAPFDQWAMQLVSPQSETRLFDPAHIVIYLCSLGLTRCGSSLSMQTVDELARCVKAYQGQARIHIVLPELMEEELHGNGPVAAWRCEALATFRRELTGCAVLIDPMPLVAAMGAARFFGSRYWYHGKLPCHPDGLAVLGRRIGLSVARSAKTAVKVVACDMDNTLWGGVVGESGWQNLRLDVHGGGGPYIRLQAFLKNMIAEGIILVGVTKNNEADVREVFAKNKDMLLQWDDFTLVTANWDSKSSNLIKIAKSLNLGLNSFCFLDDSPFERAEVRSALPEVIVPELPATAEEYLPYLVATGLFHVPVRTSEDSRRSEMYKVEVARSKALEELDGDMDAFLHSLMLEVESMPVSQENLGRVLQMLQRTNQFNVTTRRHEADAVNAFMVDPDTYSYCFGVRDKFGDSGICGLLIAKKDGDDSYLIDTFLLSCRVMGRSIERAMFEHLVNWLRKRGAKTLQGVFVPTSKNVPVADLYLKLGFYRDSQSKGGEGRFVYDVAAGYDGNRFVKLIVAEQ